MVLPASPAFAPTSYQGMSLRNREITIWRLKELGRLLSLTVGLFDNDLAEHPRLAMAGDQTSKFELAPLGELP